MNCIEINFKCVGHTMDSAHMLGRLNGRQLLLVGVYRAGQGHGITGDRHTDPCRIHCLSEPGSSITFS